MKVSETAIGFHDRGFNCAQSVLCSCGKYTGLDEKTGLAIAGGFGGGLRCGEICGAVSGAVMAVSMCCPFNDAGNLDAKDKIAELARFVTGKFRDEFGALRCDEIKGDKSNCPRYIEFCAELAEKTIDENTAK